MYVVLRNIFFLISFFLMSCKPAAQENNSSKVQSVTPKKDNIELILASNPELANVWDVQRARNLIKAAKDNVIGTVGKCWFSISRALKGISIDVWNLVSQTNKPISANNNPREFIEFVSANKEHVCEEYGLKLVATSSYVRKKFKFTDEQTRRYPSIEKSATLPGDLLLYHPYSNSGCTEHPTAGDAEVKKNDDEYIKDSVVGPRDCKVDMVLRPIIKSKCRDVNSLSNPVVDI